VNKRIRIVPCRHCESSVANGYQKKTCGKSEFVGLWADGRFTAEDVPEMIERLNEFTQKISQKDSDNAR